MSEQDDPVKVVTVQVDGIEVSGGKLPVDAALTLPDALTVAIDGVTPADGKLPVDATFPTSMTVAVDGAPAAGGKLPVDVGTPTVAVSGAPAAGGKLPVDVGTPSVAISGAPAAGGKLPVDVGTPSVSVSGTATVTVSGAAATGGKLPVDPGTPKVFLGGSSVPTNVAEVYDGRLSIDGRPHFAVLAPTAAAPAATSHAAGDVVVGKSTFAGSARTDPYVLSGLVASMIIVDHANSPTKFAGFLYLTSDPDTTYTDDAAFSVPDNKVALSQGIVSWTAADWVQHAEGAMVFKQLSIPYQTDGSGNLYGVIVTSETKTFAASTIRPILRIYKD